MSTAVDSRRVPRGPVRPRRFLRPAVGLALLVLPLPFLAALSQAGGWPWQPNPIDLHVYLRAAEDLLAGTALHDNDAGDLPFTYPPFAAIAAVPLQLLGTETAEVVWALLNAAVATAVFARIGLRGWQASLLATLVIMLSGPYSQVIWLGQMGIVLMGLVILDLAPGPTLLQRLFPGSRRLLPRGVLTGIAMAIKLTPALFVVGLLLIGPRHRRAALTATLSAVTATGIAFLVRPADSTHYWANLLAGRLPTEDDGLYRVTNQSIGAVVVRLLGETRPGEITALLCGAAAAVLAVLAARRLFSAREPTMALLVIGLGTSVAAPVSWTHTFTWIAPLAVLMLRRGVPTGLGLAVVALALWVTIEPFKQIDTSDGGGLDLAALPQLVAAIGPLGALGLIVAMGLWARWRTREGAAPVLQR